MFIVTLGLSQSTYAATADYTVLNNISAVNKIEVHGNVELFISNNTTGQLKVYNKYYSESALVQSSNGVLRISSYTTKKLVVWISSDKIRSISAYDNAVIQSFGNLSAIEFNVDLHDNASAKLNLTAYSVDITLKDSAQIELSGSAEDYNLYRSFGAMITEANFSAPMATDKMIIAPIAVKNDDLADLQ